MPLSCQARSRVSILPASLVALLLLLVACGGGEGDGDSADTGAGPVQPLERDEPLRNWNFRHSTPERVALQIPGAYGTQRGGQVSRRQLFGDVPVEFDAPLRTFEGTSSGDGRAEGYVFAHDDGKTWGLVAQSPRAAMDVGPYAGFTDYEQYQSYRKNAPDATLSLRITHVEINASDFVPNNARLGSLIGQVWFGAAAYQQADQVFYRAGGTAGLLEQGHKGDWIGLADSEADATGPFWPPDSFEWWRDFQGVYTFEQNGRTHRCTDGTHLEFKLRNPVDVWIDISSVAVGEEFTLHQQAGAIADNPRGGGHVYDCLATQIIAYLRDPASFAGTVVQTTGLTPTNRPIVPAPPRGAYAPPAACAAGAHPAAGSIAFERTLYEASEDSGALIGAAVRITRSGGSQGAVTATFETVDDSARAGVDYSPLRTTVRFADGESGPRRIGVPLLANRTAQADRSLRMQLSEPGGCAVIGTLSSAQLTIVDDDGGSALNPPAGTLDTSFGSAGRVTSYGVGGAPTAMALQADGRILMAGGSSSDFVMARYLPDGSLDAGFGTGGVVTIDIAGGFQQEQVRAVLVQPDGHIVVAGEARPAGGGQPLALALARLRPDGSLDASFGNGGKVFDPAATGSAYAIAQQADGKLVVAGQAPVTGRAGDFGDLLLARYDSSGVPDAGFGQGGRVVTDVVGGTDLARHLIVLPDGRLLASGMETGLLDTEPTGVLQLLANGLPDPAFGTQGKLRLTGALLGWGLARQADGRLLLAGSTVFGPAARFAVMRLQADGSVDSGFGTAGLAVHAAGSDTDIAKSIVLQPDGGIVLAGRSGGVNRNMAAMRLLPTGAIDPSFAFNGLLAIDFGFAEEAERALRQPDGRLLLGGWSRDSANRAGYALVRAQL